LFSEIQEFEGCTIELVVNPTKAYQPNKREQETVPMRAFFDREWIGQLLEWSVLVVEKQSLEIVGFWLSIAGLPMHGHHARHLMHLLHF